MDHGRPARNPDWTTDELILALDLYMRNPQSPAGKSSREVQELSEILNTLGGRSAGQKFRNPNGVYMNPHCEIAPNRDPIREAP